jgi:heme exporter protein C
MGISFAPMDYLQGNSYRIIFVHVPAASIALSGYFALAMCAVISLVWKVKR